MRKTRTWNDNFNNIIRGVIFPDEELLSLMMIPENERDDIIKFITKYFIRGIAPDEILSDETVRVCYSEDQATNIGSNMIKKFLMFDIYVKKDELHTYGDDLLRFRSHLIAQKIKELLTDNRYVCEMSFKYEDDYDLHTKLIGYSRHRLALSYKASF